MSLPVVEVKGLTRYFGAKAAVNDVSFSVGAGEVFALLGPNGAGKTTLMRMLLGLLEPTRGQASVFGCPADALTPQVRARVGYLAEGHHLYGWMRIKHLAAFTAGTHPRWDGRQFGDFIDYFHLLLKERIGALSNGQRAQVSLALALACDPELLVMDDPTLGLDTGTRHEFLRGIIDLVGREGRTVLFSSHILPDVERIASRIAILIGSVLRTDVPLEDFKAGIARYHLAFDGAVPPLQGLPRLVNRTTMDHEALVTLVRPGPDTEEALKRIGASACERVELSLEDAFVDYTSGGERRLAFGKRAG